MKYAFVFPGQGSQSLGMMNSFEAFPVVRETFGEASDILHLDLWELMSSGPQDALNQTVNTQPMMLAAGIAIYRAWTALSDSKPSVLAGHSLGEYSALVASNALSLEDALPLVRFRAMSMQEAVPEGKGGIAAILGLEDDAVRALCLEVSNGEVLEAVNFNSPGQVVIAGNRDAVSRGMEAAKQKGAKRAIMLPMSAPSHCSLMRPAAKALQGYLKNVRIEKPEIAVIHNVDVMRHDDPEEIRAALVDQLDHPVRWVETIRAIFLEGISHVAECGPGKVLAGLNKRIEPGQAVQTLADGAALQEAVTTLNRERIC